MAKTSEASFTPDKKDPGQDQQVHDQEDAVDPGEGGVRPLGTDVVEPVAILALAEFAFNGDALQIVLSVLGFGLFQLFTIFVGFLFRTA